MRSVTWRIVSWAEAPGHCAWITIVLIVKAGSSSRPRLMAVAESARFPGLAKLYGEGSGRVVAFLSKLLGEWHQSGRLPLYGKPEAAAAVFLDLVVATPRNKAVIGARLSRAALKAHVAAAVDLFFRGCGPHKD